MTLDFVPMTDTVTIQREGGYDDWGIATGGKSENFDGRITHNTERKEIAVVGGNQVVYTAEILLNKSVNVSYSDRIVVDGPKGPQPVEPLSIQYKRDFSGNHVLTKVVI